LAVDECEIKASGNVLCAGVVDLLMKPDTSQIQPSWNANAGILAEISSNSANPVSHSAEESNASSNDKAVETKAKNNRSGRDSKSESTITTDLMNDDSSTSSGVRKSTTAASLVLRIYRFVNGRYEVLNTMPLSHDLAVR
jgi:hypothetical protein